ncbi:MAG TPA: hypothetical protein VJ777_22930 [Mycobacterium sp.]|nr:hypothetical protein [Mycobacterium sp.]
MSNRTVVDIRTRQPFVPSEPEDFGAEPPADPRAGWTAPPPNLTEHERAIWLDGQDTGWHDACDAENKRTGNTLVATQDLINRFTTPRPEPLRLA